MLIDVELTLHADGQYVARVLHLPGLVVEAPTRDAALERIRAALLARRRGDVEVVQLELDDMDGVVPSSWPRHSGAFADDEAYAAMLAEVARARSSDDHRTTS